MIHGRMTKGKGIAAILLATTLGFVFFTFNPAASAWFPKCPFLLLTGLRCPGCGSQRAVHSLLHLDIGQAFACNALLVVSLPLIAVLFYAEAFRKRKPDFYAKVHKPAFIWGCFIVVTAWGVLRNVFGI